MLKRNLPLTGWIILVIYIIYGTFIPFDLSFQWNDIVNNLKRANYIPFYYEGRGVHIPDVISNLLLFIPYGFLLYLGLQLQGIERKKNRLIIISGFLFSSIIEFLQLSSPSRTSSITDIINNTLGTVIGCILGHRFLRTWKDKFFEQLKSIYEKNSILLALIIYSLIIFIAGMFPFDVSIYIPDIEKSIKSIQWIPDISSPTLLCTVIPFIIFGFLGYLSFSVSGELPTGFVIPITLFWGICLSSGIEFFQLFIISRVTDTINIMSGATGTLVGSLISSYYLKRKSSYIYISTLFYDFVPFTKGDFLSFPDSNHYWITKHIYIIIMFIIAIIEAYFLFSAFSKNLPPNYIILGVFLIGSLPFILKKPYIAIIIFLILVYWTPKDIFGLSHPLVSLGGYGLLFPTLLMALISWILWRLKEHNNKIVSAKQNYLIIGFWLTIIFSIVFAPKKDYPWWEHLLGVSVIFCFYFVAINLITSKKHLVHILFSIVLIFGTMAFKGCLAYFFYGATFIADPVWGDNCYFSHLLAMVIPICFYLLFIQHSFWQRFILGITFLTLIPANILTFSRGGFLALISASGMIMLKSKRWLLLFIMVGAVIFLIILSLLPHGYQSRIYSIIKYKNDQSAMGRIGLWESGINMIKDRPFFGVGIGNFEAFSKKYNPNIFQPYHPHNSFIQIAAECGLISFFLFISLIVITIKDLYTLRRKFAHTEDGKWIIPVTDMIEISIYAFIVGGSFDSEAYTALFYILIALAVALNKLGRSLSITAPLGE